MILSATQIETFDPRTAWGCESKWYFERVLGKRWDAGAAADLGTAVHGTLENYLLGRAPAGALHGLVLGAVGGGAFVEKIKPDTLAVEKSMDVWFPGMLWDFEIAGVPIAGRIDWIGYRDGMLEVLDWKTKSNLAKYAKTEQELKKDIQLGIYSAFVRKLAPEASNVRRTHAYFQTSSGKKFLQVSAVCSAAEIDAQMLDIEKTVERMKSVRAIKRVEDVPADTNKCRLARGCPHFAYCPHAAKSGEFNMASLLDAFTNETPAPAVGSTPHIETVDPSPTAVASSPSPSIGAVPPDAPKSNPALAADPVPGFIAPGSTEAIAVASPAPAGAATPPAAGVEKSPKNKGGRPKGSSNKVKPIDTLPVDPAGLTPSPAKSSPVEVEIITIRHGAKVGLPNYSSATVEVEMTGRVVGDLEEAKKHLSMQAKSLMVKELEVYTKSTENKDGKAQG